MCKSPSVVYLPNTSYMYPRLSALRLLGFDTIVPVTDGVTEDGQPKFKVVDHVLGDFDMEGLLSVATVGNISGCGTSNFIGSVLPVGVGDDEGKARWGYNYISPLQQSLPTPESLGKSLVPPVGMGEG
jgi:hypothetical protein